MHNLQITLYIIKTCKSPSRLFICGGRETLPQEGTTQGDPQAMPCHSANTYIMIQSLRLSYTKRVWLAGDSAGGGRLLDLYSWYKYMEKEEKKFGYLVNVRSVGKEVDITTKRKRHLGAVYDPKTRKTNIVEIKSKDGEKISYSLVEIAKG